MRTKPNFLVGKRTVSAEFHGKPEFSLHHWDEGERRLIVEMAQRRERAWVYFNSAYGPLILQVFVRGGIHPQDLDDVYLEFLEHIMPLPPDRGLLRFREECTLATFLRSCAENWLRDFQEYQHRKGVPGYSDCIVLFCDLADAVCDEEWNHRESLDAGYVAEVALQRLVLRDALDRLSAKASTCLVLKAEGWSDEEIATTVGYSLRAVHKTLQRSRRSMRALLAAGTCVNNARRGSGRQHRADAPTNGSEP